MDDFLNQLKLQAAQVHRMAGQTRLAVVSSVDPTTYSSRVLIQPENVLSGWFPIASMWVGAGWGLACLPSVGDQVVVLWQEGDAEHGIIMGLLWSNSSIPPSVPVGEFWLIHKSGSSLKLLNDGSISSSATRWTHTGDLHVAGDVYDSGGSLSRLRNHYDEHTHSQEGSLPTPLD